MPLEKMNLSARNFIAVRSAVRQPHGLILCVGPTGSGKTTTLHSALSSINTPDRKIWTAEDPVEISQPGMRQVQVNPKIGFTFANALRSFLRADPDVVMIGEMRDQETASIAVEAALTGHLVMSTLHTNSAAETIQRLLDMGLDPFAFSDSLVAIIAQRLVRTLCPEDASEDEIANLAQLLGPSLAAVHGVQPGKPLKLHSAAGCESCNGTGYKGRVAVHEVLVATPELRGLIQRKAPAAELRANASAGGMTSLLQDGAEKVVLGLTDLSQVTAACSSR
jgi:type II secretory ATPase GspE/PulE/Tfp pilus assembly ATPase PilB-like protein